MCDLVHTIHIVEEKELCFNFYISIEDSFFIVEMAANLEHKDD